MKDKEDTPSTKKRRGRRPADPKEMREKGLRIDRKLLSTGSTYLVSLPTVWVKEMGLRPGDLVTVIVHGEDYGFVSIVPSNFALCFPKEATIKIASAESANKIFRKIVAAYVVGYERIYLEPLEKDWMLPRELRDELARLARDKLFGTEVPKNNPKVLEIAMYVNIRRPSENLKEMCDQAMSIFDGAVERVTLAKAVKSEEILEKEIEALKDLEKADDTVDRRHHHGTRSIKKALMDPRLLEDLNLLNPRRAMGYRLIEKDVERFADHSERIAATYREYLPSLLKLTENKKTEYKLLISAIKDKSLRIKELSERMNVALSKDGAEAFNDANDAIELGENLKEELKEAEKQHKEWHQRRILESMRRIVEYIIGVGEIILNIHINSVVIKKCKYVDKQESYDLPS